MPLLHETTKLGALGIIHVINFLSRGLNCRHQAIEACLLRPFDRRHLLVQRIVTLLVQICIFLQRCDIGFDNLGDWLLNLGFKLFQLGLRCARPAVAGAGALRTIGDVLTARLCNLRTLEMGTDDSQVSVECQMVDWRILVGDDSPGRWAQCADDVRLPPYLQQGLRKLTARCLGLDIFQAKGLGELSNLNLFGVGFGIH